MNILEQELEEVIWNAIEDYNHDLLIKRGLPVSYDYDYLRQYNLGEYGRADIVGISLSMRRAGPSKSDPHAKSHRVIKIQVIELKKDRIGVNTLLQAIRYAEGIYSQIEDSIIPTFSYTPEYEYILIGKGIEVDSNINMLSNAMGNVKLLTYNISLNNGIEFTTPHLEDCLDYGAGNQIASILKENLLRKIDDERDSVSIGLYLARERENPRPKTDDLDF